jgi:hypothetical protein
MTDSSPVTRSAPVLDAEAKRVAAAAVAGAALGWWPAFTLGVYRSIFFAQHLSLWVVATSAFLAAGLIGGRRMLRRPTTWTLLLPSLWLLFDLLLPPGGTSPVYRVLFWFGVVITLLGIPLLGAFLVRLLIPGAEELRGKQAVVPALVVGLVMAASFFLGTQQQRILTCEDFTISGNFAPEHCSPGTGTTVR